MKNIELVWGTPQGKSVAVVGNHRLFLGTDGVLHPALGDSQQPFINREIRTDFFPADDVLATCSVGAHLCARGAITKVALVVDDETLQFRQKVEAMAAELLRRKYFHQNRLPEGIAEILDESCVEPSAQGIFHRESALSAAVQNVAFPSAIALEGKCALKSYILLSQLAAQGYEEALVLLPTGCGERAAMAGQVAVQEGLFKRILWGWWDGPGACCLGKPSAREDFTLNLYE